MQYLLEEFLTTSPNREIAFSDGISVNEMRQFRTILRRPIIGQTEVGIGQAEVGCRGKSQALGKPLGEHPQRHENLFQQESARRRMIIYLQTGNNPPFRFRAIHLGRDTPPQISVLPLPCLDVPKMTTSRQGNPSTMASGGAGLPR